MLYNINNYSQTFLDIDTNEIFQYILNEYNLTDKSYEELIQEMKLITIDSKKLYELSKNTKIDVYYIIQIIVNHVPEIADKRFFTRMRKLYNPHYIKKPKKSKKI